MGNVFEGMKNEIINCTGKEEIDDEEKEEYIQPNQQNHKIYNENNLEKINEKANNKKEAKTLDDSNIHYFDQSFNLSTVSRKKRAQTEFIRSFKELDK